MKYLGINLNIGVGSVYWKLQDFDGKKNQTTLAGTVNYTMFMEGKGETDRSARDGIDARPNS